MSWTDRYLEKLKLERKKADFDYLQALIEAHLHRIPFEIGSKFHYFSTADEGPLVPSKEEFLDHYERRGWGGNCYILNIHFGELLRSLGFDARYVRSRGGNAHLALQVTVGSKSYYVDVGYMAPLFEPLSLDDEPHLTRCGEEIIVTQNGEGEYVIDRRTGGQSFVVKTIEWTPVEVSAFAEDIVHSHRDEDDNPFMRRFIATIFKNRVCYQVVNAKLMIKSDDDIRTEEYTDRDEWVRMVRTTFGIRDEDARFALRFLAERNVVLFPEHAND